MDCYREDQADEYSSLRRELEQTIKNCRVLSFKLKKTERKNEQLEQEKADQEKKLLEVRILCLHIKISSEHQEYTYNLQLTICILYMLEVAKHVS